MARLRPLGAGQDAPGGEPGQVHPACLAGRRAAAIAVDRVDGPGRRVLWPRRRWGQGGLPGLRAALLPVRLGGRGRHSRRGVVMILVPGLDRAPTRAPACDLRHLSSCMMGRSAWGWPTQAATEPDMAPAHRSVLVPGGVPDVLLDSAGPVPAVWAAGRPHDPRSLRAPAAPLAAASRAGSRSATNTLCSMCQSCG